MRVPDRDRIAAGIVVAGFAVALVTIVFGGFFQFLFESEQVLNTVQLLAHLLPVFGVGLVVAVLWVARQSEGRDSSLDTVTERRLEQVGRDNRVVGTDLDRRLESAASDWYRCEETYSVSDIRSRLEESAVRVLRASQGLDTERARQAIEEGTWCDDPVAAAFLSPHRGQPLSERLRGALDPGQAFHRRVERTVSAIEALEADTHSATGTGADPYDETRSAQEVVAK